MHAPRAPHFQLIKRVPRYLCGTSHYGLQLYRSSSPNLIAYSDADWAGCPDTRKSTSGFCMFLGPPNGSQRYRAQVRRRNIGQLRTASPSPAGCANF
jgi:hypothetical protein